MLSVPLFVLFKSKHLQRDDPFTALLAFTTPWDCSHQFQSLEKLLYMGSRYHMGRVTFPKLSNYMVCSCKRCLQNLLNLNSSIYRYFTTYSFSVHVFYDASEGACVSVLYIVTFENDQSKMHLVCSRNRLALIREVALTRLEISVALI
ncbi:hypothetical protein TNCT_363831 [Trichonephila clavata]|uniref:Uncharacterized protein n=1 Tax=Trichonephila clavata TaxID=2740835 RepID=A0A8X6G7Q8_TRICU|nr:hypothetical protein TNCT_363831 [Trichonephila clavata]